MNTNPLSLDRIFSLILVANHAEPSYSNIMYEHCTELMLHPDFDWTPQRYSCQDLFLLTEGDASKKKFLSKFRMLLIDRGMPWKIQNDKSSEGWGFQALKKLIAAHDAESLKVLLQHPHAPSAAEMEVKVYNPNTAPVPRPNESSRPLTPLGLALFEANRAIEQFSLVEVLLKHGVNTQSSISGPGTEVNAFDLISSAHLFKKWVEIPSVENSIEPAQLLNSWKSWPEKQDVIMVAMKHPVTHHHIAHIVEDLKQQIYKDLGWFIVNDQIKKFKQSEPLLKAMINEYQTPQNSPWVVAGTIVEHVLSAFVGQVKNNKAANPSKFLAHLSRSDSWVNEIQKMCSKSPIPLHRAKQPYPGAIFAILKTLSPEFSSGLSFNKTTCLAYVGKEEEIDGFRDYLAEKLNQFPDELLDISSMAIGHFRTFFHRDAYRDLLRNTLLRGEEIYSQGASKSFILGAGFKKVMEVANSDLKKYLKNEPYCTQMFQNSPDYLSLLLALHARTGFQSSIGFEAFKKALNENHPLNEERLLKPITDIHNTNMKPELQALTQKFLLTRLTPTHVTGMTLGKRL